MKKKAKWFDVTCSKCGREIHIHRIWGDNTKPFYCPSCNKMVKPKNKEA